MPPLVCIESIERISIRNCKMQFFFFLLPTCAAWAWSPPHRREIQLDLDISCYCWIAAHSHSPASVSIASGWEREREWELVGYAEMTKGSCVDKQNIHSRQFLLIIHVASFDFVNRFYIYYTKINYYLCNFYPGFFSNQQAICLELFVFIFK